MTTVSDLITRCSVTLKDPENVRWTVPELVSYADEAQKELARLPGAYVKTVVLTLEAGTKQALPSDTFLLVSAVRNWDTENDGPLQPIRITTRGILDSVDPMWHMERQKPYVENYVYDDRSRKEFFVYPPNDGTGAIEIQYSAVPATLTSAQDEIVLGEEYVLPMIFYILFRAYNKDSDYSGGFGLAQSYYQSYVQTSQMAAQAVGSGTPNASLVKGPFKPNGGNE